MELVFPKLTSYQQEVYDWLEDPYESGKIAVLKSVRQSGKTFFIQVELLKMAFAHRCTSVVFEPTRDLARKVYKSIDRALEGSGLVKISNGQLLEIEFKNGSSILFRSTESMNRGLTVTGLLILDECAYLDEESIFSVLPLVNAHNAPIIIASSPFTAEGYYYEMYLKGLEENDKIKTFDWSKHPEISRFLSEEQKALYKQTMSRAKYTTEVEGDFLTEGGLLFTNLDNCIGDGVAESNIIYIGIDFATGSGADYTALSAIDNTGKQIRLFRNNNLSPMQEVDWLCGLIKDLKSQYTIRTILCEQNSIGKVYIDAMKQQLTKVGLQLTNWNTSNKSKQDLVTTFQIALENEYVKVLNNPILLNELKKYQAEINAKTKTITYNGYKSNDDTVIATMLSYYAFKKNLGTVSIAFA